MASSRIGNLAVIGLCGALSAGALAVSTPAAAAQRSAARWRVVDRLPANTYVGAIVAPSRTSAWALGLAQPGGNAVSYPVGRHWNGHRWSIVRWPASLKNNGISCAAASSPSDVWAFSGVGGRAGGNPNTAAALRLRAGRWVQSKILSKAPYTASTGCNAISPTDFWVFGNGYFGDVGFTGTWHLTRDGWQHLSMGTVGLFDASVISAKDIWAAGGQSSSSGKVEPIVARWNGKSWRVITSVGSVLPKPAKNGLVYTYGVNAISATDVWALAVRIGKTSDRTFVVHWNGRSWSRVQRSSPGYYLATAISDGHGSWWSVPHTASGQYRYLLHRVGGRWAKVALPATVYDVSMVHVPHSRAMLAIGRIQKLGQNAVSVVLAYGTLPR